MALDLDTRPEMLRPGDALRWLGEWLPVIEIQRDPWSTVIELGDVVADTHDRANRVVFYRPGCLVAARCLPRTDEEGA